MESINLQHRSGGEKQTRLLNNLIFQKLGNEFLNKNTTAFYEPYGSALFLPIVCGSRRYFSKGRNIGETGSFGTVNDISMCGRTEIFVAFFHH